MTDGEPETEVLASLQKIKLIKNQHKHFLFIFYFIKSQTSVSFVNHFDGHFAYLKTLDFSFKEGFYNGGCVGLRKCTKEEGFVDDYSGTLGGVHKVHISALVTSP